MIVSIYDFTSQMIMIESRVKYVSCVSVSVVITYEDGSRKVYNHASITGCQLS